MASVLARWSALSKRTQIIAIVGCMVVIVLSVVLALSLRDTKVALSSKPWTADQVAEVDQQLSAWSIPHVTTAENVRVEGSQRNDVLLHLALAGIPHEALGTSATMLKDVGPMTPQSVLDDVRRHSVENDLATQLRTIAGIANARVIVAPAKEAFFADDRSADASASVMLTLAPGANLSPDTVGAVKKFVASGVTGLDMDHVAVLDDHGASLGDPNADIIGQAKSLQAQIQTQLDSVLGAGMANVRVKAEVDNAMHATYAFKRLPAGSTPISGTRSSEKMTGKDRTYAKDRSTEDHGSQGTATETRTGPGGLARLSVAVAVDDRLQNQIPHIRDLVAAAAGIDPSRGDVLSIEPLPFHQTPNVAGLVRGRAASILSGPISYAIVGLTVIGVMLCITQPVLAVVRRKENAAIIREARTLEPSTDVPRIWQTLAGEPPHIAAAVISQLPTQTAVAVLDMYDERERRAISERLSRPVAPLLSQIASMQGNDA